MGFAYNSLNVVAHFSSFYTDSLNSITLATPPSDEDISSLHLVIGKFPKLRKYLGVTIIHRSLYESVSRLCFQLILGSLSNIAGLSSSRLLIL